MAIEEPKKQTEETFSTGGQSDIPEQPLKPESTSRLNFDDEIKQQAKDINILKTAKTSWDNQVKNIRDIQKELKKHNDNFKNLETKINTYEERVRNTELRSIEVVGIISSIIALVLAFIDTANSQRDLKDSFSILLVGAASLILFAVLIHNFFNKEDKRNWIYYLFAVGLPVIIIFAIGFLIFFK